MHFRTVNGCCTTGLFLLIGLSASAVAAQADALAAGRTRFTINDHWRFLPADQPEAAAADFDDAAWTLVEVPHTWNGTDFLDDEPGYRRGPSWYRKKLHLAPALKGKRLVLYFEGVHQLADVFVNGKNVGQHKGGYTAFACDITDKVTFGDAGAEAVVAVRADNSHNDSIPPLDIGFAHYGGIYRDVWVIATDPVHFDVLDHAAPGLFVDTPQVSAEAGTVRVRGTVVHEAGQKRNLAVITRILDAGGKELAQLETESAIDAGQRAPFEQSIKIASPHLWSPETPYLYTVETDIRDGDAILDRVTSPLGFRWFKFDPEQGFFLNGQRLALRGASRHQDYAGLGSALPNNLHRSDLQWLKDMGGNFIRLAHYPQDPVVLETCDRIGLVVWEEIPIVSTANPTSPEFREVCRNMLLDMIRQHSNHPSIMMWGYMNEVLLKWGRTKNKDPEFPKQVADQARELEALVHKEDPTRVTVMAMDARDLYNETGIADIAMVPSWNIYMGWYGGTFESFGRFMDDQHKRFPKRPMIASEYGAGSDARLHSLAPVRFDHTTEWQRMFHKSHLRQMASRPFIAGTLIWNQFDFSQPEAADTIPHMNQKGMMTFDRKPKDVYYLYQANLSKEPVLYIASREWNRRTGTKADAAPGSGLQAVEQPVEVYSNLAEVELLLDGKSLGRQKPDDVKSATWKVPFHDGWNVLEASGEKDGRKLHDVCRVHFTYRAPLLADASVPFVELAVNVGGNAQYIDDGGVVWEADQVYKKGAWGCIMAKGKTKSRGATNTKREILGTSEDPLYQWYVEDLSEYRFDVPDGEYELELRLTEPTAHKPGERVLNINANGQVLFDRLDLATDYGVLRGLARTFQVHAEGGKGITVHLEPVAGHTILSGIRVRKIR